MNGYERVRAAVEGRRPDRVPAMLEMDTAVMAGALGVPVAFPAEEPARTVRLLVERFHGQVYVRGNCDQLALSLATMARGAAEFYMDLCYEEKEVLVHELLEYCTGAALQYIRLMAQTGCDMVSNGDSPAGPDLISPEMYERFALPYEKRVADEAHRLGLPYALHICGDTTRILDAMVRTGTDCLELDYKTDTAAAHAALKDRVTLIGNIDPSGVLRWGDVNKVEAETRALCRAFADTPRFILNAGIPQGTPSDNIRALVRVAREFGG